MAAGDHFEKFQMSILCAVVRGRMDENIMREDCTLNWPLSKIIIIHYHHYLFPIVQQLQRGTLQKDSEATLSSSNNCP